MGIYEKFQRGGFIGLGNWEGLRMTFRFNCTNLTDNGGIYCHLWFRFW